MVLHTTFAVLMCFHDASGEQCVERLGSAASGRERLRIHYGARIYEAEANDLLIVDADESVALEGLTLVRPLMKSLWLYRSNDGSSVNAATRLASQVDGIRIRGISPDLWLEHRAQEFPNDPLFVSQWYLDKAHVTDAWKSSIGSSSVTVAVIDDGCDLSHPDLREKLLPGRDVVDQDDDPTFAPGDMSGHGTACAGIIGASTNNSLAMSGTCPSCTLRCVRLIAPAGALVPESADVDAFAFALEKDVSVASNSWSYGPNTPVPAAVKTAIRTAITTGRNGKGMVVVFASGNDNGELETDQVAAVEGVISVGSVNLFLERTQYSNFGSTLSLVAPAGTITLDPVGAEGASPGDTTTSFGGTSSACPVVAGIAGLMLSYNPNLTAAQVADALMKTATPSPYARPDDAGHDVNYGFGVVNAAAAMEAIRAPVTLPAVQTIEGSAPVGCGCTSIDALSAFTLALFMRSRRRCS